ncbi:MAG: hypothetical protein JNL70_25735 [Saprospiraceae bacterium]|nr:hypothetical protein [Saprospiraceae bacterium]
MSKQIIYTLILIFSLFHGACADAQKKDNKSKPFKTEQTDSRNTSVGNSKTDDEQPSQATEGKIPAKVYRVLQYVREHGQPMEGYVGGRTFQNRERQLVVKDGSGRKIKYQEWDVNPKRNGVNRGAERLVTGSDNRAWYTKDHYQTFVEVK